MAVSIFQVKKQVIDVCKRIYDRGYVAANDGNVSVRLDDGHVIMTPTGMSKGFLQVSDLVVIDMAGNHVSGSRRASSESKMHLSIFKARSDVHSVVHAHPPTATGFAVAGIPLTKCILPEVIISVGSIPIAEYATPGTQELAEVMVRYLQKYDAVLLENHGAITVGDSVFSAHYKMETLEHFAKIMFVAYQLGNVRGLPPKSVEELVSLRERYGIRSDSPTCDCENGTCQIHMNPKERIPVNSEDRKVVEEVTRKVMEALNRNKS